MRAKKPDAQKAFVSGAAATVDCQHLAMTRNSVNMARRCADEISNHFTIGSSFGRGVCRATWRRLEHQSARCLGGVNYVVQASTNLTTWFPLWTNGSTPLPFLFTDPGFTNFKQRFYRVLLGP